MVTMTVSVVSGIGSIGASTRVGLAAKHAITVDPPMVSRIEDTVELSPAGIAISRSELQSHLRSARVSEIHAEIKAGTFMTAERVDGTVERLLKLLG